MRSQTVNGAVWMLAYTQVVSLLPIYVISKRLNLSLKIKLRSWSIPPHLSEAKSASQTPRKTTPPPPCLPSITPTKLFLSTSPDPGPHLWQKPSSPSEAMPASWTPEARLRSRAPETRATPENHAESSYPTRSQASILKPRGPQTRLEATHIVRTFSWNVGWTRGHPGLWKFRPPCWQMPSTQPQAMTARRPEKKQIPRKKMPVQQR